MESQSIFSNFKRQFAEGNKEPVVAFRRRDIILFALSAIGLLITLLSTSTTNFVPLLRLGNLENVFRNDFHLTQVETNTELNQENVKASDIPAWGKVTKLASSNNLLCFYDTMHVVLMSKESLDAWGDYKSYFTNRKSFDAAFFIWLQEQFPHGYTTFRAQAEGSEASKFRGSTAQISSVTLTDTHMLILYENWGLELYSINSKSGYHLSLLWFKSILRPYDDYRNKKEPIEYFLSKPREVTVRFLNHAVHEGDHGLIVIGARSQTKIVKLGRIEAISRASEFDKSNVIYSYILDQENSEELKLHGAAHDVHYSYFGVELHTGEVRWRHESDDFQYTHKEVLHPQHSFKVDTEQDAFHTGEVHWRNYVEDILGKGTPHLHRHDDDTTIVPAHFRPTTKRYSEKATQSKEFGQIGSQLNKVITTYGASKKKIMDSQADEIPNVLVVHLGIGIEVIHIYSGRTLCQLTPLKKNVAYGDLNSDGSLNAVQVVMKSHGSDCVAEIESGNKGNSEVVFQTSICTMQQTWRGKASLLHILKERYVQQQDATSAPMAVAPVIVKRFNTFRNKIEYDVIFLASSGLATCISNEDGKWKLKWQVETRSGWSTSDPDFETSNGVFFPHISLYRLNENSNDKNILLVGREILTVMDLKGNILQTISLPKSPVIAPISFLDADLDGKLDIQVEAQDGVYLFSSKQKPGSGRLSFMLFSLMAILGVMFLSTNINIENPFLQRRSPDL